MKIVCVCKIVQDTDHPLKPWMPEAILKLQKARQPYTASWQIGKKTDSDVAVCLIDAADVSMVESIADAFTISTDDRATKLKDVPTAKSAKADGLVSALSLAVTANSTVDDLCKEALSKVGNHSVEDLHAKWEAKIARKS
jgi:hypothetical protein